MCADAAPAERRPADHPCEACGGVTVSLCRVRDLNRAVSDDEFHYVRCSACGYIFLRTVPQDLSRYYPEGYYTLPETAGEIAAAARLEHYKLDLIRPYGRTGNLLEIGPGRGNFCYLAHEAGFRVFAVEQSAECRKFLEHELGVTACATLDDYLAMPDDRMPDVVALWHVIEHLVDPWEFLQRVAARMRPGGIVIIATPNPQSVQFRLFGKRWAHLDAPRHVKLIPASVLDRKLTAAGLQRRLVTTKDEGSIGWNSFGWAFSCANFFKARTAKRLARGIGRILGKLAAPIEHIEGAGAAYTAIYQKPAA
jgi:SAM-dependent methyltransferase